MKRTVVAFAIVAIAMIVSATGYVSSASALDEIPCVPDTVDCTGESCELAVDESTCDETFPSETDECFASETITDACDALCVETEESIDGIYPWCDGDGVASVVEDATPFKAEYSDEEVGTIEFGDGNDDAIPDLIQPNVASLPNPNDTEEPDSYVTLESLDYEGILQFGAGWRITKFEPVAEAELPVQSSVYRFPVGLFDIELTYQDATFSELDTNYKEYAERCFGELVDNYNKYCDSYAEYFADARSADLRLIFDRVLDLGDDFKVIKFNPLDQTYASYDATVANELIGGAMRTVVYWTLVDNAEGDSSNEYGVISDPISLAVTPTPAKTVAAQPEVLAQTGSFEVAIAGLAALMLTATAVVVMTVRPRAV